MPARSRLPFGARPRRRAMLVDAPVLSMKTSRAGSRSSWPQTTPRAAPECRAGPARRRGRTFFDGEAAAVEKGPDRAHARRDGPLRREALLHLNEGDVRGRFDEPEQEGAMRIQL